MGEPGGVLRKRETVEDLGADGCTQSENQRRTSTIEGPWAGLEKKMGRMRLTREKSTSVPHAFWMGLAAKKITTGEEERKDNEANRKMKRKDGESIPKRRSVLQKNPVREGRRPSVSHAKQPSSPP